MPVKEGQGYDTAMDAREVRKDFPILDQEVNGQPLSYLDNAATSQKPRQVINELKRFYDETLRPLVSYDEQYETDLLGTLQTFLDCDANVNATAARLITHRHTIRYRFERVRELTGLDVSSTDGREKLSLGLKAMRVLGIAAPRGPATEPGAEGGRVPH